VILSQKPQTRSADPLAQHRRRFVWARQRVFTLAVVAIATILIAALPKTAVAVVRITNDHGGNIGAYWSRYMALRDAGEQSSSMEPVRRPARSCSALCRMIEFASPQTQRSASTPHGDLVFSASRSSMIQGLERFGTSIPHQSGNGSVAMAVLVRQLFISLAPSSLPCIGNVADYLFQTIKWVDF
jgi:hypothetical protein